MYNLQRKEYRVYMHGVYMLILLCREEFAFCKPCSYKKKTLCVGCFKSCCCLIFFFIIFKQAYNGKDRTWKKKCYKEWNEQSLKSCSVKSDMKERMVLVISAVSLSLKVGRLVWLIFLLLFVCLYFHVCLFVCWQPLKSNKPKSVQDVVV